METFEETIKTTIQKVKDDFMANHTIPATLLVFQKDGEVADINIQELSEMYRIPPGLVFENFKPGLKKDENVCAAMFITEAWFNVIDTKNMSEEEKEKLKENAPRPSLTPDRKEMLLITAESRDGLKKMYHFEIKRIDDMPYLMDEVVDENVEGRCVGIFD